MNSPYDRASALQDADQRRQASSAVAEGIADELERELRHWLRMRGVSEEQRDYVLELLRERL